MKVAGIGVDIVETVRIELSLQRFGDRFLKRVFTEREIEYCQSMKFPARHFAARFAAKEAVSKAFGTGIGKSMGWKDIEVRRKATGEPFAVLHDGAREMANRIRVVEAMISLSHSDHYAVANAVLCACED
jgi:holo-[acyl-carrier protein] synthase